MAGTVFRNLDARLEELKKEDKVEGVIWGLKNGFAIASKGLDPVVAGFSASLLKNGSSLSPDRETPIIFIEGQESTFLIKSDAEHNLTVKRRNS